MIRKRRKPKPKTSTSISFEDICIAIEADSEEDAYGLIFTGATSSVKPVWLMSGQIPIEEYWIYNCPHIKFCCRTMSMTNHPLDMSNTDLPTDHQE